MKSKYLNIPSIIFNFIESALLFIMAMILELSVRDIMIIFLTFEISRTFFKLPKHYKKWQQCLIWTLVIFGSLFVVAKINILVGVLIAIFSSYILSGRSDLKDLYLWCGKESKHSDIFEYIKYNKYNKKLLKFEKDLQEEDNLSYMIYKYRFKENKSFCEISELLDMDTARISEIQDNVAFALRITLHI